ncbi:MAG: ATP-binding protein [Lachnospiraceae bacterium]|nr:ATP-binding protein [Lachnospiraceae bacterium]
MEYINRITDALLEQRLDVFGATFILGPKGCGKTTSAKHFANSFVEFQDEDQRENLLLIANTKPSDLLIGAKPRLLDEWQDAPKVWGAVRKDVDDTGKTGQYILTGSSSMNVETPHTGTLRISRMNMYPMSLFESGDSNGAVSLTELFDHPEAFDGCKSDLSIDGLKHVICRGGWPASLKAKTDAGQRMIAKDLFHQTAEVDISKIDNTKRNPVWARTIMKAYARNLCTLAETKTIIADVAATCELSKQTYYDYCFALEKLMMIEDVDAWNPAIRSKTAIRSSRKRNFMDPSIGAAALGISPEYFSGDYKTLGFLFESLCIRDLKIYSSANGGRVSYYHDRFGLEADVVLHLEDGRYALAEIKLGQSEVEEAATHLNTVEGLVREYNEKEKQVPLRLPDLKLVITGTQYGYKREDGVFVIPIGCLKD